MSADSSNPRLAVLIDADNTFKVIDILDELFEEISKFGDASVRRIYGDWTQNQLSRWKEMLPKHAIQPIQQYANTKGKNATDSALIIDAMDLLYTAPLDGFCIVSSDSDFTRLAIRFRESGKLVYGFGEKKTPESLQAACNEFKYFEILSQNKQVESESNLAARTTNTSGKSKAGLEKKTQISETSSSESVTITVTKKSPKELARDTKLVSLIRSAIEALSDEDGFAHMGEVKKHIVKNFSAFDSRNYGYSKFSDLIKTIGLFEVDTQNQRIRDKRKR
ncbi:MULTISPECIES: NYN domain-containing protein [Nitrosomonas]|uniref:Maebl n=1 Tax=Nitrosomonas communis TaxID=44574 RepID=A0A0F7K9L4_9PROT|nr:MULTISPECIES: NYN domain-containing protein [Nitrosomonas]AKH36940.1 Maebl [Nitrosomonas communis]TYP87684.1 OST-HTH/LOTUS domain-containing protein [Nitrosomonas communis]UVS62069.1 NYN domain-containing protein [Nitrosomonas sp. PLL12]